MSVRSSQSITKTFTTRVFATGVATNADSLPTGTLYVNGTADAASVTVTNVTTGFYKAAVTLPTLAVGDVVDLRINATVSSVTDNAVIWSDTKDLATDANGKSPATIAAGDVAADAIDANALKADAITEIQSGLSTLTQSQVTGGAYALNSASFAFNSALDFTTAQKAATLARVTLVDTTTTNTDMRGTDGAYTGTPPTASAISTQVNFDITTAHGAGSYQTATGFSTHSAADVRTELATELLVMTRLGTAIVLDGAVYQFTTNALENAPGGAGSTVNVMPVSGSATIGNVLDGGRIRGQYGAPLTGLTITCTTTNAGTTTNRDLAAYSGGLAFVVFDNDDTMDYGTRIVHGSDITVSSNVATISSTASHVLNTLLGENLRWCLRQDTAAPSIVFAIGDYTCQRAPVTA